MRPAPWSIGRPVGRARSRRVGWGQDDPVGGRPCCRGQWRETASSPAVEDAANSSVDGAERSGQPTTDVRGLEQVHSAGGPGSRWGWFLEGGGGESTVGGHIEFPRESRCGDCCPHRGALAGGIIDRAEPGTIWIDSGSGGLAVWWPHPRTGENPSNCSNQSQTTTPSRPVRDGVAEAHSIPVSSPQHLLSLAGLHGRRNVSPAARPGGISHRREVPAL